MPKYDFTKIDKLVDATIEAMESYDVSPDDDTSKVMEDTIERLGREMFGDEE